jgi:hypothetical protein
MSGTVDKENLIKQMAEFSLWMADPRAYFSTHKQVTTLQGGKTSGSSDGGYDEDEDDENDEAP